MKAIITRYLGPTISKGSRVKAVEPDGKSITLDWDSKLDVEQNHIKAAQALCSDLNWGGDLVTGYGLKNTYVHVFRKE